jgi:flagellar motor protein MotB
MYWGMINARVVGIGVLAAVLFLVGWTANGWRLNQRIAEIRTHYAQAEAKAQAEARKKEQALVEKAEQVRKRKDEQIKAINNRLAAVTRELRERPSRSDSNTSSTATCSGGTGSTLFREDGEFLIGEAARADRLRQALKECYARYEEVRKEINNDN